MGDPRVRRRINAVIDWVLPYVAQGTGPYEWSAKNLRKVFGNTSNNALSRWLMANVLQQTGFYRVGEFPYAYLIRPEGIEKMLALLQEADQQKSARL
ncbi:hypothetical protein IP87_02905 [beta proteobacterium AAP121]|nr:hypothetical protein IP80_11345 [beta proteobacterium AAP65]KPG00314.1 hypothetical protein IP87_02905 [beta proteobacterium AAP121]